MLDEPLEFFGTDEGRTAYASGMGDTGGLRGDDARVIVDEAGRAADRMMFEQRERLVRRWYTVRDGVWCLVGNGLSNQSFVRGPEGIIAIDTGESVEEMQSALDELRAVTDEPIVAVLYTHFHYINGTTAITEVEPVTAIHGHFRIALNLGRTATEIAPAYGRGLVEQFGVRMPEAGPDGLIGVGLGNAYRNPAHAPFTAGHLPVTHPFDGPCTLQVAGLEVVVQPAPSDADDSVTFWFPALGVAVHNIVWPTLFNVFAIRGEEYRDPRVLLAGIDHLRSLGAEHLVATHGPPMSGAEEIARRVTAYRDSLQFLWDQTVRWTNRGATSAELAHLVRLPDVYGDDWITQQHYGLVEHHTRQIRSGLFGFFDGDPANLLPLHPADRAERLVSGLGGHDAVRTQCRAALGAEDPARADELRWALELAAALVARPGAEAEDRLLLAEVLRCVARRTTSANVRNWCIARALHLDGTVPLDRLFVHSINRRQAASWPIHRAVAVLRVLVDPDRLTGVDLHVAIEVDGARCGLHFRNHIACPTDGCGATTAVSMATSTWIDLLTGGRVLADAVADGSVSVSSSNGAEDAATIRQVLDAFACLDHAGFAAPGG